MNRLQGPTIQVGQHIRKHRFCQAPVLLSSSREPMTTATAMWSPRPGLVSVATTATVNSMDRQNSLSPPQKHVWGQDDFREFAHDKLWERRLGMRISFTFFFDWRALWGYFCILLHIRTCESLHCLAMKKIYLSYIWVRVEGFQCPRLWLSENPWQALPTEARLISNFMEYNEDMYCIIMHYILCIMITHIY